MIKKNDFVSGERLLQSFPYIVLDKTWLERLRKNTLILAEKAHHYFIDTKAEYSIRSWQKRIIKYLEVQGRLPFPLFRLASDWFKIYNGKQFLSFQSARGEDFKLPFYLTEELAYLTGVVMGDGYLSEYFINIIDASKKHIENLCGKFNLMFTSRLELFKQPDANAWNVNIFGKWIVRFINFLSGQPITTQKYLYLMEPLLLKEQESYQRFFWRGMMDADGSYVNSITFGTASKHLSDDFASFLDQHIIHYKIYEQGATDSVIFSILGLSRAKFISLIGSSHPEKLFESQLLLNKRLYRTSHYTKESYQTEHWSGQVIGVNIDILLNGTFDFSLLNEELSLANLGSYFTDLRNSLSITQRELAKQLNLTQGSISQYELNHRPIPISILVRFFTIIEKPFDRFVTSFSKIQCYRHNTRCLLDTRPVDSLFELLRGVRFKSGNHFSLIGLPTKSIKDYKKDFEDYFGISIKNHSRVYNSILLGYVKQFFLIRK